jgi:hypothetical protein
MPVYLSHLGYGQYHDLRPVHRIVPVITTVVWFWGNCTTPAYAAIADTCSRECHLWAGTTASVHPTLHCQGRSLVSFRRKSSGSFETSVFINRITWSHTPEDSHLHNFLPPSWRQQERSSKSKTVVFNETVRFPSPCGPYVSQTRNASTLRTQSSRFIQRS